MQSIQLITGSSQSIVSIVRFTPDTMLETLHTTQSTYNMPSMVTAQLDSGQRSPVQVIGDEISIDERRISKGDWHEYTLKGKKYVLHVPEQGVIEIYEVKK